MRVSVEPAEATVWLDGEAAGTSPLSIPVAPGRHVVEVHKDGFRIESRVVDAEGGRTTAVHFELVRSGGSQRETPTRGRVLRWVVPPLVGATAAAGSALAISARREPAPIGDLAPTGGRITYEPIEVGLAAATRFSFVVEPAVRYGASPLYSWQFGDGASAEGQSAFHVFQQAGTFTVELTADAGSHADRHRVQVDVCDLTGTWHAPLFFGYDVTLELVQTGSKTTGRLGGTVTRRDGTTYAARGALSGEVSSSKHVVIYIQTDATPGDEPFAYRHIEADLNPACTAMYGRARFYWGGVWVDFSADRR